MTLVTGPVRSGKSAFAARLARQQDHAVTFVATARRDPDDPEWQARLARHARERPAEWLTFESAGLTPAQQRVPFERAARHEVVLLDALGTWLDDRMRARRGDWEDTLALEVQLDAEAAALAATLSASQAHVIVVAEQVGWDVVPAVPSARIFRDVLGRLTRRLAADADRVYLVVAGYAIDLRAYGAPLEAGA